MSTHPAPALFIAGAPGIPGLSAPPGSAPRALVLAPHPDDFDAVAVTLGRMRDHGCALRVAVLTSGASGVEDAFCPPGESTFERKRDLREAEQRASCAVFGLHESALVFLRLPEDAEGHVVEDESAVGRLRAVFDAVRPGAVFLPHGNDTNADHQRVFRMARSVALAAGWPVTAWYHRDPKTVGLRADVAAPFGQQAAEWKAALLRCHRSQHERNLRTRGHGLDERMLRVNAEDALALGLGEPYAEVFEIEQFG